MTDVALKAANARAYELRIFSIVPICLSFDRQFKDVAKKFPTFNEVCRIIFALLFLPIRGVYWPCARFQTYHHPRRFTLFAATRAFVAARC